jgi:hypothetical protein
VISVLSRFAYGLISDVVLSVNVVVNVLTSLGSFEIHGELVILHNLLELRSWILVLLVFFVEPAGIDLAVVKREGGDLFHFSEELAEGVVESLSGDAVDVVENSFAFACFHVGFGVDQIHNLTDALLFSEKPVILLWGVEGS